MNRNRALAGTLEISLGVSELTIRPASEVIVVIKDDKIASLEANIRFGCKQTGVIVGADKDDMFMQTYVDRESVLQTSDRSTGVQAHCELGTSTVRLKRRPMLDETTLRWGPRFTL